MAKQSRSQESTRHMNSAPMIFVFFLRLCSFIRRAARQRSTISTTTIIISSAIISYGFCQITLNALPPTLHSLHSAIHYFPLFYPQSSIRALCSGFQVGNVSFKAIRHRQRRFYCKQCSFGGNTSTKCCYRSQSGPLSFNRLLNVTQ